MHTRRHRAPGFRAELLSKPIRYGYINGIALTVLISQLPKLFGFSVESEGPCGACGRLPLQYWKEGQIGWHLRLGLAP